MDFVAATAGVGMVFRSFSRHMLSSGILEDNLIVHLTPPSRTCPSDFEDSLKSRLDLAMIDLNPPAGHHELPIDTPIWLTYSFGVDRILFFIQ